MAPTISAGYVRKRSMSLSKLIGLAIVIGLVFAVVVVYA
jgi:hypothetical protein